MTDFSPYLIHSQETIREAFKKQDLNKRKFVLVVGDEERVMGIVTDGDFRRAVWNSISLEDKVESITNKKFIFLNPQYTINDARKYLDKKKNIRVIPVLDDGLLTELLFKEDFFKADGGKEEQRFDFPVVIMAGGKGTRLDPFTRILPKPLIPVGNQPVIEHIMDKFSEYGMNQFFLSIHEKSKMIRAWFEDFGKRYELNFVEEKQPLGTIGSLALLKGKLNSHFFVSNCDIVIDAEYSKIIHFHQEGHFILTLVGSVQHFRIPYGICEVLTDGRLANMKEKPEYDFVANTGMYLMDPEILDYIPDNQPMDINQLINLLKVDGRKVGVFPISAKSWVDVGQWDEYQKTIKQMDRIFRNSQ